MVVEVTVLSVAATASLAALGAFLLSLDEQLRESVLPYLIALSTGAIFGGVFIHLIFRYTAKYGFSRITGLVIAATIGGSFFLERAIHWHCHHSDADIEPFSYMIMAGDAIHNVFDGIIIASGYVISLESGLVATVGIVLHKIPKELGDFAALVQGGFSEAKALAFNLLVGGLMFAGAALVLAFRSSSAVENLLLPVAIGSLVYIGGTDLFPEIRDRELKDLYLAAAFFAGLGVMYSIVVVKSFLA